MFRANLASRLSLVAWLVAAASTAAAWESDGGIWSVNGFGTLGALYSDEDRGDYVPTQLITKGAGRTHRVSFAVDSRAALQLTARPTNDLSAIAQIIVEQNPDGSYDPHFEWLNLQYSVTPKLDVRVGRTLLNTFLASSYRKVGYAMPWVRPPAELYRLTPVTNNDGVDLTYRTELGNANLRLQMYYGSSEVDSGDVESKAENAWGTLGSLTRGPITINLAHQEAEVRVNAFDDLASALRMFGPPGNRLAERYAELDTTKLTTLGASFDPGGYFLMAEWARVDGSPGLGLDSAWYVSGGYRFGSFVPYLSFARSDGPGDEDAPDLPVAGLPPALAALAMGLNAELDTLAARTPVQETVSLGLRWDAFDRVAFKVQYDHVRVLEDSMGTFINLEPGYRPDGANLLTVTMDWVF